MKIFSKRRNDLAVWGWWQGRNLGDNWIKSCMRRAFPNAVFLKTTDMNVNEWPFVIIGGGGLFIADAIPPFTRKIRTRFGALGLGAEFPHTNNRAKELADQADFFFVRDKYSLDCMRITNSAVSRDVTFYAPLEWAPDESKIDTDNLFWVWRGGDDFLRNPDEAWRKRLIEYGRYKDNRAEFEKIVGDKFKNIKADDFQTTDDNVEERIKDCGFVISGRFHGIIAAIQKGLPCIAIDICPKIRALMLDVGLEEYIIKMDEADRLPNLISLAKKNIKAIRAKQWKYRSGAIEVINNDVDMARLITRKHTNPKDAIRGIHYGAYWMGENDVINAMASDLSDLCNLVKIDLKIYDKRHDKRVKSITKTPNGHVTLLDTKQIIRDLKKHKPDFILLNSAGIVLEDEGFEYCRSRGVTVVGTAMSDPDVYPYNGAEFAHKFDLFYTNAKYSLETQYDKSRVNIKLMPFAASIKRHFYMPQEEKKFDIVVVGHARPDRLRVIEKLKDFKLGLFGEGWGGGGTAHGLDCVRAINSGKIYLSFAATNAGFNNVKVGLFEAMARNTCVAVSYMDELNDYFKIGEEVLCYNNEDDLIALLKKYLADDIARENVRAAGYERFLREHTYRRRFVKMLNDIKELRDGSRRNEYYDKQRGNLLYPNEEYINHPNNKSKADLHRFNTLFNKAKHLGGRMLDIGCNDGFFMRSFNWKFKEYVGVDMFSIDEYTNGRYEKLKEYYTKDGKIKYITGLMEDIDKRESGEFDFIFAGEIIEHLPNTSVLFETIKHLLRGGGCLSSLLQTILAAICASITGSTTKKPC